MSTRTDAGAAAVVAAAAVPLPVARGIDLGVEYGPCLLVGQGRTRRVREGVHAISEGAPMVAFAVDAGALRQALKHLVSLSVSVLVLPISISRPPSESR